VAPAAVDPLPEPHDVALSGLDRRDPVDGDLGEEEPAGVRTQIDDGDLHAPSS
jgi:hypothetical protein